MIWVEGNTTVIVTAIAGVTFVAALVLTVLIGQRLHRDWRRVTVGQPPPSAPAPASLRSAKVIAEDAERRHADRALEETRLHQLRAETEAWQERLNGLRQQAAAFERRAGEIETIKAEIAGTREDGLALRQELAAARVDLEERTREDTIRAGQAAALGDRLERDRLLATDLATAIAEAQSRQRDLIEAEAETRGRLETLQAELARCREDQDALRRILEASRLEIDVLDSRSKDDSAAPGLRLVTEVEPESPGAAPEGLAPAIAAPAPEPLSRPPATVPVWTVRSQSVAKPRNDSFKDGANTIWRRTEDRFRLTETATDLLAAVSDGAGASGLFCGAWAGALVGRLPDRALTGFDDLNGWLDGFCLDFHREFAARAKTDPRKHSKFVQEGSFATLTACWLTRSGPTVSCRWLAYGDSPLLVFDRTGDGMALVAGHPGQLSAFDRDPQLLNWKTLPEASALKTGEIVLPGRATVVLASDGIGQFLLLRYLAALQAGAIAGAPTEWASGLLTECRRLTGEPGSRVGATAATHLARPLASFADELTGSLATESAFAALVAARCEESLLPNDDATLIMIDVES